MTKINSTASLRKFLLTEMEAVADGSRDLNTAKGIANMAQQVYNTISVEIRMAKAKADLNGEEIPSVKFSDDPGKGVLKS